MSLRRANETDSIAVSHLLSELGYAVDEREAKVRLLQVLASSEQHLWISEVSRVDGFVHFYARSSLEKGREVVVQALVVSPVARRTGVGRKLMEKAEEFAERENCRSISLHTNADRSDAHRFYSRLGFVKLASSDLMKKAVGETAV